MDAFAKLHTRPVVVMVDGAGYAHPRRVGIASHLGLLLDLPTIGCAKSRLLGTFDDPAPEAGSTAPLMDKEELIGQVVRTKDRCKPLFISVGHKIDLASAVRVVLETGGGYRVPEPTRQAHLKVNAMRIAAGETKKSKLT
jgi:deoxyribonuclease V